MKRDDSKTKGCNDPNCPFHGRLSVRGQTFEGTVASNAMQRTVVVEMECPYRDRKYNRIERRTDRLHAHLPPCIDAPKGSRVRVRECRPLSKTVSSVVVEVL